MLISDFTIYIKPETAAQLSQNKSHERQMIVKPRPSLAQPRISQVMPQPPVLQPSPYFPQLRPAQPQSHPHPSQPPQGPANHQGVPANFYAAPTNQNAALQLVTNPSSAAMSPANQVPAHSEAHTTAVSTAAHTPQDSAAKSNSEHRDEPAAKIRRLNDGSQAIRFNLRGGIGGLGGLGSDSSDLLQNLLGVEENAIDRMLDSNADSAAKMLGVQ